MSWFQKYKKSLLVAFLCLLGVFGGLACIIHAEYVSAKWANTWYWSGGILMGAFILFFAVWFSISGRNNS